MPLPLLGVASQLAAPVIAGVTYATDPARRRNRQQIKSLEGDVAAGKGLDDAERQLLMNTGMAPVRAQVGSMASELGRLQAAGGGLGGGATLAANRNALAGTAGMAAERVGSRVGAADIDALAGKREELEARYGAQAQGRADFISQLAGIGTQQLAKMGEQRGVGMGYDMPGLGRAGAPTAAPAAAARSSQQVLAVERAMVPYELRARFDAEVAKGLDPLVVRRMLTGS
jgi:hypothetical protein